MSTTTTPYDVFFTIYNRMDKPLTNGTARLPTQSRLAPAGDAGTVGEVTYLYGLDPMTFKFQHTVSEYSASGHPDAMMVEVSRYNPFIGQSFALMFYAMIAPR
ncbi:uncharacterized protein H6S33_001920 [Morchella sextelata]|uniref:uncharacterized protein n=1 Tax=Morchella sextelata TaxID=1174677 RepID=UPI001D036EA6|nr:uncharacterized protein H6S33_001920 [Morchella sextelata]KAH0607868.1 hypothetical protein H6S33_001920 [Morchella sextelata]